MKIPPRATGIQIDVIGDSLGIGRAPGETDDELRDRLNFRYFSPRFEASRLPPARAGQAVRPHSIVVTTEGASSPNAYFAPAADFFKHVYEVEGWQPLTVFALPGCDWLHVDAALRQVADDRFYIGALPEFFAAWSAWQEDLVGG